MKKIKVLMVLGNTKMGGTQIFILNLLKNIDLEKFQVDLAVNSVGDGEGIGEEVKKLGCRLFHWPYFKVYNYMPFVRFWNSFFKEHHYDIVHGHSTNSASIYLGIAKKWGCVTIAHSHSAGYRGTRLQQYLKRYYAKDVGKVADYWFACSDKAAERLYGVDYRSYTRYYDIPNAINAEDYLYNDNKAKSIRHLLGVNDDDFLCGHVGTFSQPKNHVFLLDIFSEVLKMKPNAKLVCCGVGDLMNQVKKKADMLGLSNKVVFPGVVKNSNEYLMAMDAFVFPSLFEGFPISIIEAEAAGLHIVMSDVITNEVDMTSCVHRCSLSQDAKEWANRVCDVKEHDRKVFNKSIVDSKYNMRTSVQFISNLYERMYTEGKVV